MAGTSYTRQSTFIDGDTITAALFNDEYNQLVNAFSYASSGTTGHQHDGTAGEGGNIHTIGDQDFLNKIVVDSTNNRWGVYVEVGGVATEQIRIQDGAIVPVTDNGIDLGTSSLEFKDLYLDGTANIDSLIADTVDINAGTIDGTTIGATSASTGAFTTLAASGATTLSGTLSVEGNTTLGNAATDTVTFTADVSSNILPSADSTYDLGDGSTYWANAYIDAVTTTGNVAIGGNLTVTGNATIAGNLTFGDAATDTVAFSADVASNLLPSADGTYSLGAVGSEWQDLYIDGTANIDSLVADTADINGGTIDSTAIGSTTASTGNFSTLSIGGTAITATAAELNVLDGITSTVAELNILDGVTSTASELNLVDGSSAGTIVNSKAVVYGATGEVNATTLQVGGVAITSTPAELNVLDGITATVTELNYTDGVTSNIQTQLDTKAPLASPTFTGTVTIPDATVTGDVSFGDNDKAIFGAGSDLEIYSDGANAIIDHANTGAGALFIKGDNNVIITNQAGTENKAVFASNGAVTLYYDNAAKLATTSTGIDVTGTVVSDAIQVDTDSGITLKDGGDSRTLTFKIDAGTGRYQASGSADHFFTTTDSNLARFYIANNGDISFYEDTGTTAKFFWDASAESLGIGTTSPTSTAGLHIQGADGASGSSVNVSANEFFIDNNGNTGMTLGSSNTGTGGYVFADSNVALRAGMFYTHSTDQMSFRIASQTRVSIDSSGNVGIGTDSPTDKLHIHENSSSGCWTHFTNSTTGTDALVGAKIGIDSSENIRILQYGAKAIRFYTTNTEVARIDSSGNVGVGTSSPAYTLDVSGDARFYDATGSSSNYYFESDHYCQVNITSDKDASAGGPYNTTIAANGSNGNLELRTNSLQRVSIDQSGNVGIGTTSPASLLHVQGSSASGIIQLGTTGGTTSREWKHIVSSSTGYYFLQDTTAGSNRITVDTSGNVGIGSTSPSDLLELSGTTAQPAIRLTDADVSGLYHRIFTPTNTGLAISADTGNVAADSFVRFDVDGSEKMRIDSSGNVGIGVSALETTSSTRTALTIDNSFFAWGRDSYNEAGVAQGSYRNSAGNDEYRTTGVAASQVAFSAGTINLQVAASGTNGNTISWTDGLVVDNSGNVGIGTDSPSSLLTGGRNLVVGSGSGEAGITIYSSATNYGNIYFADGTSGSAPYAGYIEYNHTNNFMRFGANASEDMRIDSSGNLLVNTTDPDVSFSTSAGSSLQSNGQTHHSSAGTALVLNRTASDGTIAQFRKAGTTVGSIASNNGSHLVVGTSAGGGAALRFYGASGVEAIRPSTIDGANRSGVIDLGASNALFDDIYATNATIQTSDANEKQDIESLSEAEQRVAVACKGLLRKFRWKSAVEEKGDEARIHFGIIAQDLQAAFEVEGLDAGRYAMFIHSTWTDEETGEERSRMGVRYSELLAFIIAAI